MEHAAHNLSSVEVARQLLEGDPPIAVLVEEGDSKLRVAVWTLADGEHRVIARRIQEIFNNSAF